MTRIEDNGSDILISNKVLLKDEIDLRRLELILPKVEKTVRRELSNHVPKNIKLSIQIADYTCLF